MPLYTYGCGRCGHQEEHLVKYSERDVQTFQCPRCVPGWLLVRQGVELFRQGQPGYQMQAVLGNGAKLKGHFGKAAQLKGKR